MAKRNCFPIPIPPDDPKFTDRKCLKFIRSEEVPFDDCRIAPRQQANDITSWLDASFVYGSYDSEAEFLRTKINGEMILRFLEHFCNMSLSTKIIYMYVRCDVAQDDKYPDVASSSYRCVSFQYM